MGSPAEHVEKAGRNRRFLDTISDEFPEWLATVAFYTAVELVEQLLAAHGHHGKNHFERKQAVKKFYPNVQLNRAYNDLYNASLDARYLAFDKAVSAEEARKILIGTRLRMIEEYVAANAKTA